MENETSPKPEKRFNPFLCECEVCGGQVARDAEHCPHCGHHDPAVNCPKITSPADWFTRIMILILLLTFLAIFFFGR